MTNQNVLNTSYTWNHCYTNTNVNMKRSGLVTAIKTLSNITYATGVNYAFNHGFIYRINEYEGDYPLIWLNPPVLVGRNKSRKEYTYKVTMFAFVQSDDFTEDEKETEWEKMETALLTIYHSLPDDANIVNATDFNCEPDEFTEQRGSVSVMCTFNVTTYDC